MINVVGRPPLAAAGVRLCTFEHVLCDTSSMPCDWLPCHRVPHPCHTEELREAAMVNGTVPITLENLGQIRRDPCCSAENFVLDSCDDAARELESAFGAEGGAVVCDLTTVDEGRDVDGLARVAARLSARKRRSGDTSSKSARTAVTAENWRSDGDDWCLWSWRSGTARALAAGDEIYADYAPEYIEAGEWFANTGFVPPPTPPDE